MVFICISSILVKLSNIWVPFSSNCTDFCSYTFKHLLKKCHNFFKGGRGLNFLYFVTIFYVTITLGVGGVSPNLINVSNFAVFLFGTLPLLNFCPTQCLFHSIFVPNPSIGILFVPLGVFPHLIFVPLYVCPTCCLSHMMFHIHTYEAKFNSVSTIVG